MVNPAAEEKKELGNKAFAAKDYDEAIKFYSEAIEIDPTNHVYFSNRSACHGSQSNWKSAASDASECVRLDPTFTKGYYRLVTAQLELQDLENALTTVKQGLNIDPDNSQLLRQLRTVKSKRRTVKRAAAAASNSKASEPSSLQRTTPVAGSSPLSNEVLELQEQYVNTNREYKTLKAHIAKSQKEQKINEITKSELETLPTSHEIKMYQAVGKAFLLSSRNEVMESLEESTKLEKKRENDLVQKMEYLEKKMNSQQSNIQELLKTPTAE